MIETAIPFVDLDAQYTPIQTEIEAAIGKVLHGKQFILGAVVEEFEQAFADYCSVKHCVTVHTGTAALHLALLAAGIGPGDEVILPANTFIATAEAVSFCGAKPVLVDVCPNTYTIDPQLVEAAVTSATKAIIAVHLYGQPADMPELLKVARKHKLLLVEDACQAHGATISGAIAGSIGDVGCFSFYPGKNLGAAGEGGAVVTNDTALARKIELLRNHGSSVKYQHEIVGHNFRLDSIQCAVLNVKLPHLNGWNRKRQHHARYYTQRLSKMDGVVTPQVREDAESVFHLYVIRTSNRKVMEDMLKRDSVGYGIHYPVPIHLQPAYANLGLREGSFPISEGLCKTIISLPMFPELNEAQLEKVVASVSAAAREMKQS